MTGFNESWPVPAQTWEEATDDQGRLIDDTLPPYVKTREDFDRWHLCLKILARQYGVSVDDGLVRIMARYLFLSDLQLPAPEE